MTVRRYDLENIDLRARLARVERERNEARQRCTDVRESALREALAAVDAEPDIPAGAPEPENAEEREVLRAICAAAASMRRRIAARIRALMETKP